MGLEMPRSFTAPTPAERKRAQKERQEFTPNPFERVSETPVEKLERLFDKKILVDMDALDFLISQAEHDESLAELIKEQFIRKLGPKFGPRVFEDWEYREALKDTARTLASKLPDSNMPVCTEGGLKILVAAREILGEPLPQLVQACDMRRHLEEEVSFKDELEQEEEDFEGVLSAGYIEFDPDSGECTGDFSLRADFKLSTGEELQVFKRFERSALPPNREGDVRFERVATYEYFTVPNRLQSRGYAAREMNESVTALREAGFDRLALHANIDVGGYAWAVYGFGWDERQTAYAMAAEYLKKKDDKEQTYDVSENDVARVAPDIVYPSDLNEKQIIELARRNIASFAYARRTEFQKEMILNGICTKQDFMRTKLGMPPASLPDDLRAVWYELVEMEQAPGLATPQRLATLGKDLPRRLNEHTIGKSLMLTSNWYGSVDLQTDNENIKILSARLAKSSRL